MGVFIIAEAGVNHNGDIELAKKLIDMAVEAGADAIKFQTFKAEESTSQYADKPEYQKQGDDTESQLDMIKKLELPFEAFDILSDYAAEKGIVFISTPDGQESLDYLIKLNVPFIKIGSTEVTNHKFLCQIAKTNKPILLSTGMSTLEEVERAVNVIVEAGCKELSIMHCTTSYPTDTADVNLLAMVTLKDRFGYKVGFSDHTLSYTAAIAAVALGAAYIEKHITTDKNLPGPDHKASMGPEEFKEYIAKIRETEILLGDGVKKPTQNEIEIMKQVRRSILANRELKAGTILSEDLLCYKRPGDGICPESVDQIIGKRINRDIKKEEKILWTDLME